MQAIVNGVFKARARCSGEEILIRVSIGHPQWTIANTEAACPLTIEGLYRDLAPIRGIDPTDALRNAIRMVDKLLTKAGDKYDVYWSDGSEYEPAA